MTLSAHRPPCLVTERPGQVATALALILVGLVLVIGALSFAAPAGAQTTTTTAAASPPGLLAVNSGPNGYFEFTLQPGGHTDFAAIVKNLGATAATYQVYAAEATTGSAGGVAYSGHKTPPGLTAAWLHVPATDIGLAAGAQQQVSFAVTVPAGTAPGDYLTAIAAESPTGSVSPASTGSGANVQLTATSRVVVAVVVHVPGPTHAGLNLGQPGIRQENGGRQALDIPFNDDGDSLLKPHLAGTITKCSGGEPVVRIDRRLDTFVPHTKVTFGYPLAPTTLPEGCYRIDLRASYDAGPLGTFRGTLTVTSQAAGTVTTPNGARVDPARGRPTSPTSSTSPGPLVVAGISVTIALLLAVLILLAVLLLRRRRPDDR